MAIRKTLLTGLLLLGVAIPAAAHDFWIETDRFVTPDEQAVIKAYFKIGTAEEPEPWNLRRERIVALRSFGPDGVTDQQAEIVPGEPGSATIRLAGEGTHVVTLETSPAESDLPAGEFNDYIAHEGLTAVNAWRIANGQSKERGRETYSRRAKVIVQLGNRPTDIATRPTGLGLEIVPLVHPMTLTEDSQLPVRLYFRGRPLAGARMACESFDKWATRIEAVTDDAGQASCAIMPRGRWKISAVWSVHVAGNPRAEFDTIFTSLTFGY